LFLAGLDAVWELDLFGGRRRNVESATANVEAAEEGIHGVLVSIIAETALDYIQLRGIQQQIVIAQENLKAQQRTADITRQRFSAGFVGCAGCGECQRSGRDDPIADPSAGDFSPTVDLRAERVGGPPACRSCERIGACGGHTDCTTGGAGGCAIRVVAAAARYSAGGSQLHAATAQIGVAIADLFPKFSLTGSLTYQNNLLQDWFTNPARGFSFGPSVTWPILQGGAIRSNIRAQKVVA
jgi:hypothetical protein